MKAIIFGATGMVGQGVLRECLLDPEVEAVLTVGRTPTGQKHEKLRELAHANLLDFSAIEGELSGYDACFFCLGVTSAGTTEQEYERITYAIPVAAAQTLVKLNPGMTFVYVSGSGADSSERSRTMWARVKGKAENALLAMPFKAVYVFRPAFIQPLHGIRSRTKVYNVLYAVLRPLVPLVKALAPGYVTTTEQLGRAMIAVAKRGPSKRMLESSDISQAIG
jgi:uncharacterized protein YbjT (DUF2867 family)